MQQGAVVAQNKAGGAQRHALAGEALSELRVERLQIRGEGVGARELEGAEDARC